MLALLCNVIFSLYATVLIYNLSVGFVTPERVPAVMGSDPQYFMRTELASSLFHTEQSRNLIAIISSNLIRYTRALHRGFTIQ
jgi:hypothetical protein